MPDLLPTGVFAVAVDELKELVFADHSGRVIERIEAPGHPRFPAARPGGGLAYLAITDASPPWQVILVVLDAAGQVVDLVPDAAIYAPPVWSKDGATLLLIRGDLGASEIVEWSLDSQERPRSEPYARSATRDVDGRLVWSAGGAVHVDGAARPRAEVAAARGLQDFGSDDLYVTIDQVTLSPRGRVAAVERWYRQGLRPKEHVVLIGDDGTVTRRAEGRYPRWVGDDALIYTSEGGSISTAHGAQLELPGMVVHSADWVPEDN